MKKILFSLVICAMMLGFASCEQTTLGKKNVLINLAELGDDINGKSIEEIEKVISRKDFTKFYEWSMDKEGYFNGMYLYSNGIQLDSTWFGENVTSKIRLQDDNACVLLVDYYKKKDQIWVELTACYILPNDPTKDYKTLSNNLYRYCSTNYSFKASAESLKKLTQEYTWSGDIETASTDLLYYCNDDEKCNFALQTGLITQEEYNKEMAGRKNEFRIDFVEQLKQPYLEVYEEIEAVNIAQNKYMYANLLISNEYDSFFEVNGIMVAEFCWTNQEPSWSIPIQKRFLPNGRKVSERFHRVE